MALDEIAVTQTITNRLWPMLLLEQRRVARIDKWMRWDHDKPHRPRHATKEYEELSERAQAPWGRRVVTSCTDQLYVDGYRPAKAEAESPAWQWWAENGLASRQIAIHEALVGYGLAYTVVLPGRSWLGEPMPVIRALDPSQMVAVYDDPAWDDWPVYALRAIPTQVGMMASWRLRLYDSTNVYDVAMSSGGRLTLVAVREHGLGVCPVVRYSNHLDLRGRSDGDIEPVIPVLGRIDQTAFDRLVVQRFASWKVRTIAGMAMPETIAATGETPQQAKLRLKVEDVLVSEDADTKFGTLDETPLEGFIAAHDADVRVLAAVSQSPAHELIGQMANLSAEALAAAEASLSRRVRRVQYMAGAAHRQTLRLAAHAMGDEATARDAQAEIQWRDMESRSLAQEADALGKLATMLNLPVEVLWDKVSILTQTDVERAKQIVEQSGGMDALLAALNGSTAAPSIQPVAPVAAA